MMTTIITILFHKTKYFSHLSNIAQKQLSIWNKYSVSIEVKPTFRDSYFEKTKLKIENQALWEGWEFHNADLMIFFVHSFGLCEKWS